MRRQLRSGGSQTSAGMPPSGGYGDYGLTPAILSPEEERMAIGDVPTYDGNPYSIDDLAALGATAEGADMTGADMDSWLTQREMKSPTSVEGWDDYNAGYGQQPAQSAYGQGAYGQQAPRQLSPAERQQRAYNAMMRQLRGQQPGYDEYGYQLQPEETGGAAEKPSVAKPDEKRKAAALASLRRQFGDSVSINWGD